MLGQLGCKLFRSPKLGPAKLRQRLSKYSRTTEQKDFHRSLVENVVNFRITEGRARFTFLYDFVFQVPYRDETQKVLRTAAAEVTIVDPPNENIYYIYGRTDVAKGISARLSYALAGQDDFIEDIVIPPERLRKIIKEDVLELKYGWWDGIDTYARKGALKGNVLKSKYYNEFKKGEPTSMTFESKNTGGTIRLTARGSITLYGQDLNPVDLENYVTTFVLGA